MTQPNLTHDGPPQEAGPRPDALKILSDREHRLALRDQVDKPVGGRRRLQGPSPKGDEPTNEPKNARRIDLSRLKFFPRTRSRIYGVLLGTPPTRVMENKPPLLSFAPHRWLHFWLYAICRIYKWERLYWVPIARPSVGRRSRAAIRGIRNAQFTSLKCIASFSKKGGVGKTSILKALTGLLKNLRRALDVLAQDNNPDRGTLADRGRRTVRHCIMDLLINLKYVQTKTDFARYCNEMEEGSLLLASTRPDEFTGELDITAEDFNEIHTLTEDFFDVVLYDCGTDAKSLTNQAALAKADVIQLISTPAKDSIYQAVMTYVWMCKHSQLRSKHVILVINRRHWWTNLDRIQKFFMDTADAELAKDGGPWRPSSFRTLGVGWDLRLSLGLNFTSLQLRRGVRADLLELLVVSSTLMADCFADQPESQLTHLQQQEVVQQRRFSSVTHHEVVDAIQHGKSLGSSETGKVGSHA